MITVKPKGKSPVTFPTGAAITTKEGKLTVVDQAGKQVADEKGQPRADAVFEEIAVSTVKRH
jgi:hypothetical protein